MWLRACSWIMPPDDTGQAPSSSFSVLWGHPWTLLSLLILADPFSFSSTCHSLAFPHHVPIFLSPPPFLLWQSLPLAFHWHCNSPSLIHFMLSLHQCTSDHYGNAFRITFPPLPASLVSAFTVIIASHLNSLWQKTYSLFTSSQNLLSVFPRCTAVIFPSLTPQLQATVKSSSSFLYTWNLSFFSPNPWCQSAISQGGGFV